METLIQLWDALPLVLQILIKIGVIMVPLLVTVAYFTYAERKVIGYMQVRIGPNRVGWRGLLQPIADAVKLMFKEIVLPTKANKTLFLIAPMITLAPALAAWAVFPFGDGLVLADINAGLLYILALTSLGVYGVIIAGWASNSKYAFLGAMRSAAQIGAYALHNRNAAFLERIWNHYRLFLVPAQVDADGAFRLEVQRPASLLSALANLDGHALICEMAYQQGVDLYSWRTPDGRGFADARPSGFRLGRPESDSQVMPGPA